MTTIRTRRLLTPVAATLILAAALLAAQVVHAIAASTPPRVAFVARSDNPVDALAAGAVAAQVGGVVLLTTPSSLEQQAEDGLADYNPDLVILAGGNAALTPQIEDDLDGLGYTWERVAGATRTETARLLAERLATLDKAYLGVAQTAVDSDKLEGRAANELTRSASFETNDDFFMPAPVFQGTVVDIEAPAPGWLVVSGGTSVSRQAPNATVHCHLFVSGQGVAGTQRTLRLGDPAQGSCQTGGRVQVAAGTHEVRLVVVNQGFDPNNINASSLAFGARNLLAQYVPFDGDGSSAE